MATSWWSLPGLAFVRCRRRWSDLLGGLVSIAFGVVVGARLDIGAVTPALLLGLYRLVFGVSQITMGIEARNTGRAPPSVTADAA